MFLIKEFLYLINYILKFYKFDPLTQFMTHPHFNMMVELRSNPMIKKQQLYNHVLLYYLGYINLLSQTFTFPNLNYLMNYYHLIYCNILI